MPLISTIIASIYLTVLIRSSTGVPTANLPAKEITYEEFLNIPLGWTHEQIAKFLNNNPGQLQMESLNIQQFLYTSADPFGVVLFELKNNQLTMKTQSGITSNHYPITRAQFDQIERGMSRAQVTALVGNEGQLLTQDNTPSLVDTIGYNVISTGYPSVQIIFGKDIVLAKLPHRW